MLVLKTFIVMKFHLIEVLSIIAIFLALLMSYYFITLKKGSRQSNSIFSSLLFVFSILITCSLIYTHGASWNILKLTIIGSQFALLIGPLIYFYIISITDINFRFKIKYIIHFIPFILITFYFFHKTYIVKNFIALKTAIRIYSSIPILIQNLIYIILILITIRSYNIQSKSFVHNSYNPLFRWLRFVIIGYIAIWSINIQTFVVLDLWEKAGMCPYMYSLYFLVFFLFVNAIVVIVLKSPALFTKIKKYENSSLSESDKEKYKEKLISYIDLNKPYLNSLITLTKISKEIHVSTCYLSQIINESFNQNFRDFINKYRIEESKYLLKNKSYSNKTILEIAYTVGFNSKSAFNAAFKKFTGLTPKQFRNGNLK